METRNILANSVKESYQPARLCTRKHPLLLKGTESKIKGKAKDRLLARGERTSLKDYQILCGSTTLNQTRNARDSAPWGSMIDNWGIDLMREAKCRTEKAVQTQ
jgi:hypothetical protein